MGIKRPVAVFFLPEPPPDTRPPRDYRRLPEGASGALSARLRFEIRRVALRQDAVTDLAEFRDLELLPNLGAAALSDDAERLAGETRKYLRISLAEQRSWANPHEALGAWIRALESWGILVFQASRVSIDEMRGMSFHHDVAPAVLLNSADAPRGRVFSLAHELAHLVLGSGALCDLDETGELGSERRRVEAFCNHFAACLLVPGAAMGKHPLVAAQPRRDDWTEDELLTLSREFSVSTEVILRRLVTLGKASIDYYLARRPAFLDAAKRYRERQRQAKTRPPWFRRVIAANGRRFTRLVLDAYEEELITGSDVAEFLGTKLDHLGDIEQGLAVTRPT